MRVGVVGVGRIGAAHAEVVRDHPDVDSVLLADADASRARAVADKLGVPAAESVEQALTASDAIVVAATTAAHPELILRAVEAGLPVFCEKPVAPDLATSRRVLSRVRDAGVQVQIGFQRRFDAGYTAARDALRGGRLGELRRVHVVTADQAPPPADFLRLSGGIFRDCHVHDFDAIRWVTGEDVVDVVAVGTTRGESAFEDAGDVAEAAAVLTLSDGTLVTLQGSRFNGAGHDVRMELAGTRATYAVGLDGRSPLVSAEPGEAFPEGAPWPNFWTRFTPAYVAEIRAFVEVARGERPSPCTVEDAVEAFYVAEAADRSLREKRRVAVDEVRFA
jgi:predicted dehydrogenase